MAGPSDIVPLEDVSEVAPAHAEVRPLLSELDGVAYGGAVTADATTTGDGVDIGLDGKPFCKGFP